jgi:hypothetical protein
MKRGFLNSAKVKREPLYSPSSKDTSGGATSATAKRPGKIRLSNLLSFVFGLSDAFFYYKRDPAGSCEIEIWKSR